ncbi:VWA domain-containing protein [Streptomyces sp. DSM 44915]|uniref:VWA domain-containing protein n=1 Tax=Streptomyces chisholmiae TaxID=3075540 RepID=A0ABU2JUQ4_9ACTN|nr:VWA domain-containing protein [Streptomyces sp. DSM 44915]MDT0268491.1 VWA domain-containing protein [Streptomyces sp. DSM 44915]
MTTTEHETTGPAGAPDAVASSGPGAPAGAEADRAAENRRQILYWRLLARLFDGEEQATLESASVAITEDLGLPPAVLDPGISVDNLVQRFPELGDEFRALAPKEPVLPAASAVGREPGEPEAARTDDPEDAVRRAALITKLLLNTFATGSGQVTAAQLGDWQRDAQWCRQALGAQGPGELAGVFASLEGDLVSRMQLREVLADPARARQLTPSMSLIEQLLHDKDNLSGVALANAKALIRRFVDEVAEVLRTEVEKTSVGAIDRSVPPKRVFRNLDVQRTIWKNLTNWNPDDQRLYVDRLFYRHTARRTTPGRLIVVVDQSGSMVDSMVNCAVLASIFAGLPKIDVHLVAYDTRALDLTPWVHDPFEVLLRTRLGGGNNGPVAMAMARQMVTDPDNTVMVWISDFYEVPALMNDFRAVHRTGIRLIPVGSVTSSGRGSVNPTFRRQLKELGTPVISGHIRKLVFELKNFLA